MTFDRQRFHAALRVAHACAPVEVDPEQLAPQLHWYDTLPSTNRTLWEWVDRGVPPGTVVIAAQQQAGRGQWGRQWSSPLGGLYLSVVLHPDLAIADAAQLTLSTGWGIATALRTIPGQLSGVPDQIPVGLKWLNDLVLHQHKLGGILTETRVQQATITRAIVGVGINWTNPVPEMGINLQQYLESQPVPLIESLEMLAAITLVGILAGSQQLQRAGIVQILPAYLDLFVNLGQSVNVDGQTGTVVGVAPTGELQVQVQEASGWISDLAFPPGRINLGYGKQ